MPSTPTPPLLRLQLFLDFPDWPIRFLKEVGEAAEERSGIAMAQAPQARTDILETLKR